MIREWLATYVVYPENYKPPPYEAEMVVLAEDEETAQTQADSMMSAQLATYRTPATFKRVMIKEG